MKAKRRHILFISLLCIYPSLVIANDQDTSDDQVDADFLEFLADMEEATGSGFYAWLNEDLNDTEQTEQQK